MPIKFWKCPHCKFESEDENEVIEHEKTHSIELDITYVKQKETQGAKLFAVPKDLNGILVTIVAGGEKKQYGRKYIIANTDVAKLYGLTDPEWPGDIDPARVDKLANDLQEVTDDTVTAEVDGASTEEDASQKNITTN